MRDPGLRIAFFPDAFHEIDGVATVGRRFQAFAKQHDLPFLMAHAGPCNRVIHDGSVVRVQLRRGPVKFPLDSAHEFDLLFLRHYRKLASMLREFRPDMIQITGPSDVGILGALLAHNLKIPLAAFWQTNLPEYAGLRVAQTVSFLPAKFGAFISGMAQQLSHLATMRFYKIPSLLFAPNPEIAAEIARATGKPCFLMGHGVDTAVFHPEFRNQQPGPFTIGYVGRLSAEKNVRNLARLERDLLQSGHRDFRFVVVGQGAEETWLRENLQQAEFHGVLGGIELSRAYANMEVLAFPSETDTFGLVVLEALASGVPVVVTASGGPKYTVQHGETGYIASTFDAFVASVAALMTRPDLLSSMRRDARRQALSTSWSRAFGDIYEAYAGYLTPPRTNASAGALNIATIQP